MGEQFSPAFSHPYYYFLRCSWGVPGRPHLPKNQQIDPTFLERVIQRCKLTGGQIRNTALHASLLALRQDEPVTAELLDTALQREFQKASHPYPLANTLIPN